MPFVVASAAAAFVAALLFVFPVHAESYPTRIIKLVVPYPAGGTSELIARVLAKKMGDNMGQTIVIENYGGASGAIGAERVANATPDGYTLLFGYATQFTIVPAINRSLPYDPLKSFKPVGAVARFYFLITANSQMPFKTLAEFVSYAKAHPGDLTFASPGIGTATHMIGELLKLKQAIDIVHVPYRGGGPAIIDYVAGRTSVYWDAVDPLLPWVTKGNIRPLAVTSAQRLAVLPDVPTVIEAGMPDLNVFTWTGLFAPAGTPNEIVSKLETELNKVLQDKELQALFEKNYYEVFPQSPAALTDLIRTDLSKWRAIADAAGIKLD